MPKRGSNSRRHKPCRVARSRRSAVHYWIALVPRLEHFSAYPKPGKARFTEDDGESRAIGATNFVENSRQIMFDGVLGKAGQLCDLCVALALCHPRGDFTLTSESSA